ncbi:hypothetical protein evm_007078 [Chilo suppressalis]|nr:hypothetical protein evm_007078 [Chilo suppressalis]
MAEKSKRVTAAAGDAPPDKKEDRKEDRKDEKREEKKKEDKGKKGVPEEMLAAEEETPTKTPSQIARELIKKRCVGNVRACSYSYSHPAHSNQPANIIIPSCLRASYTMFTESSSPLKNFPAPTAIIMWLNLF